MTSCRQARSAAICKDEPDKVVPTPECPDGVSARTRSIPRFTSSVKPQTPVGMPPATALPATQMSGSKPKVPVQPPGPVERVCVSSISKRVPCARVKRRTSSRKSGAGATMPQLVKAGSIITQAMSPGTNAAASASASLKGTQVVTAAKS